MVVLSFQTFVEMTSVEHVAALRRRLGVAVHLELQPTVLAMVHGPLVAGLSGEHYELTAGDV